MVPITRSMPSSTPRPASSALGWNCPGSSPGSRKPGVDYSAKVTLDPDVGQRAARVPASRQGGRIRTSPHEAVPCVSFSSQQGLSIVSYWRGFRRSNALFGIPLITHIAGRVGSRVAVVPALLCRRPHDQTAPGFRAGSCVTSRPVTGHFAMELTRHGAVSPTYYSIVPW